VDLLDVGQGDSIFVTFPDGGTLLVDGGGRVDHRRRNGDEEPDDLRPDQSTIGESVVSAVLWYKGYAHVDHILATHADADHIQGLNDVARNFSVNSALFGRTPGSDPEFAQLSDVLDRRKVPAEVVGRGQTFRIGGAVVEVLYPLAADDAEAPSDNDHSVVLRISYGSRSFLLTGDIERAAEIEITSRGGTLAADVVKVPHHGSRTSSTAEFINAAHPQYAIISVGRHSPFGHPHQDVVERWQLSGAKVLTTGENGMISVSTDGRDLQIERYMPAR
jgi:competence protein ComEC